MPEQKYHVCQIIADVPEDAEHTTEVVGEGEEQVTITSVSVDGEPAVSSIKFEADAWTAERAEKYCSERGGEFVAATVETVEDESEETELQESELKVEELHDVEILGVGDWDAETGPVTISLKNLEDIVESFHALREDTGNNYDPPVKLGHDEDQKLLQNSGYPAAGYVRDLELRGETLVATSIVDVPFAVAELIRAGGYKYPSVELAEDEEVNGRKYSMVLTAVSILGEDLPAVKNINDLLNRYRVQAEERHGTLLIKCKAPEENQAPPTLESLLERLDDIIESSALSIRGRKGAPQIRAYLKGVRSELGRMIEQANRMAESKKEENMSLSDEQLKLREMLGLDAEADDSTVLESVTKLQAADPKAALRASQVVRLAMYCGKLVPAQQEWAEQYAARDEEGFVQFVESTPQVINLSARGSGAANDTATDDGLPGSAELTELELSTAVALGVNPEDIKKVKKEDENETQRQLMSLFREVR